MKILIESNERFNIRLPIPSGFVLNRISAGFVQEFLKEIGLDVTKEQAIVFIKELKRYRRQHPEWVLAEIQSSDGEYVRIKL